MPAVACGSLSQRCRWLPRRARPHAIPSVRLEEIPQYWDSIAVPLQRLFLLVTSDQGQVSGLCLLDLTAAFDTVDHELLPQRLDNTFGVRDQAKEWFTSYLTGRSYCVIYGGRTSATVLVTCSVPQGLVVGPLLFVLYTAELADLAAKYGVKLHAFADDNQLLHVHCDLSSVLSSVKMLEQCISAISQWMSANLFLSCMSV